MEQSNELDTASLNHQVFSSDYHNYNVISNAENILLQGDLFHGLKFDMLDDSL